MASKKIRFWSMVALVLIGCEAVLASGVNTRQLGLGYTLRGMRQNSERARLSHRAVHTAPCCGSYSSYDASTLGDWDLDCYAETGFEDTDFQVDQWGTRLESDTTALRVGMNASKGRAMVMTQFQYEYSRGEGPADGVDARTTGVSIMPGYRVWTQEENGLDVAVFGILDMAYLNGATNAAFSTARNQWRLSPGAGVGVGYMSQVGLFQAGYTYLNSRNIDGDVEVTGDHYIDMHTVSGVYTLPITENILSSVGIDCTTVENTPIGMPSNFTVAQVGLSTRPTKNWRISGRYYESIDSSDTRGFNLGLGYLW